MFVLNEQIKGKYIHKRINWEKYKRTKIKGNEYQKINKFGIYLWVIKKLIMFNWTRAICQAVYNNKQKIPAHYNTSKYLNSREKFEPPDL